MRPKIDSSVIGFDFLFDIEDDVAPDPYEQFLKDAGCAGSFANMSSDVAHRHIEALREEMQNVDERFAKRFGAAPDSQLEKSANSDDDEWTELVRLSKKMVRQRRLHQTLRRER